MSSDPLRQAELLLMLNNQMVNSVDRRFSARTSAQQLSLWDAAGLSLGTSPAMSPSDPTTFSVGSLPQQSPRTGLTTVSPGLSISSQPPTPGIQSRPVLPARRRTRDGHERKRSRLGMDVASPVDSIEYWLNFDKDDTLPSVSETPKPQKPNPDKKESVPRSRRPSKPIPPSSTNDANDFLDDSALENALSDDDGFSSVNLADQLTGIESAPPQEVPPREGLYSTPLSWERPQPGIRMDSLNGVYGPSLNEAEQRRLISIAMNSGSSFGGLGSNLNFNFGGMASGMPVSFSAGLGSTSTNQGPKPVSPPCPSAAQSRSGPSTASKKQAGTSDKGKEKLKTGERAAHNDIERKYRTNLKDKISELRDAVPTLRSMMEEGGEDDEAQSSRAAKVSKGTVLAKAIEYIHQLERRNKQIVEEHRELSRRLQAFEQLLSVAAQQAFTMPAYSRTLFDPRGFC
ncbi:helix-loop-helix DNA-binding domain-containing protein [Corynascus novoguineensis]|uniref:Helix-loop-helix DNA-binding domain-containing protein n=1 Tax=Corynascus novoguineensis TaxID=1126955 RepID=A0AAN7CW46_9PEZI|nr:helix-loop-helix DNA-binding domain-containing protein [Corynascus novoguineensis]